MPPESVIINKKLLTSPTRERDLKSIIKALLERRDLLRRALAGDLATLYDKDSMKGDNIDMALETAKNSITSVLAESESQELQRIEETIDRISEGTYGICVCGKSIPIARLKVLPYTERCINCQREAEITGED